MMSDKTIVNLPLSSISIGRYQHRKREVGKALDQLAASIARQGLIQPITVCPSPDEPGMYEVLAGQRRFLAHQSLNRDTIEAIVVPAPKEDIDGKVISLTENMLSEGPAAADYVDICTELYHKYGDLKVVQAETGLPYEKVKLYVKFDRLQPEMQTLVKNEGIDIKIALRAQDAVAAGGYDAEKAVALAKNMMVMTNSQREKAARAVEETPSVTVDHAIEIAKTADAEVGITLYLQRRQAESLKQYAKDEGTNSNDAAMQFITQGLTDTGYLTEDEG
jgi:ParB family chromosome partitioning protein